MLGCLYGLLAVGYTLVYGIVGRINLAFGEIAMVGAYTAFIAVAALALLGQGPLPLALLGVLLLVAVRRRRSTASRSSGWCSARCATCPPRPR